MDDKIRPRPDSGLKVSDPHRLGKVEQLCALPEPYNVGEAEEELFLAAMRENLLWHREKSPFFRQFLEQRAFDPEKDLKTMADLPRVPFLLANFFKRHEILSIAKEDVFLHLTSSGTTGQKSQIFFDEWSLMSAQRMVSYIFEKNGWIRPEEKTNYLLYTYEPRPVAIQGQGALGTSYTDHYLCGYAPTVNEAFYALRSVEGKHEFDPFGCVAALERFATAGLPVRIFGFPSFLYFTLLRMKEMKRPPVKLHPESLVFLGGGWKGHADKSISKGELYALINEHLGIPDERLRDGYGSVEHCIPYVECEQHQFHVPVWSRVIIRDVKTLAPLALGQRGFLQFLSPYITSVPAMSVLMGDLSSLHPGAECPCPIETPFFQVHGRAGTSQNKSCAIAASELLGAKK